jgi:mannosyltransferase OCH1-like enzyme
MIPKIIHQIWIGPNDFPIRCKEYVSKIQKINSNFEHMLWTETNIPELPELVKKQYDRYYQMNTWAFVSDILRYFVVSKYGGIYVDVDCDPKNSMDVLTNCDMFVVSPNTNCHWICNGIFGAKPKHQILEKMINTMDKTNQHGPIYFTNEIKKWYNLPVGPNTNFQEFKKEISNDIVVHDPKDFFTKNGKYLHHIALASWHKKKQIKL